MDDREPVIFRPESQALELRGSSVECNLIDRLENILCDRIRSELVTFENLAEAVTGEQVRVKTLRVERHEMEIHIWPQVTVEKASENC